tara:strand:+ start:1170 stop:1535 length:366 start_codon:yes stop_codon:yes gene_type:complete
LSGNISDFFINQCKNVWILCQRIDYALPGSLFPSDFTLVVSTVITVDQYTGCYLLPVHRLLLMVARLLPHKICTKSHALGRWFIDSHLPPNNTRVVLSRFVPNDRQQPWRAEVDRSSKSRV